MGKGKGFISQWVWRILLSCLQMGSHLPIEGRGRCALIVVRGLPLFPLIIKTKRERQKEGFIIFVGDKLFWVFLLGFLEELVVLLPSSWVLRFGQYLFLICFLISHHLYNFFRMYESGYQATCSPTSFSRVVFVSSKEHER